MGFEQELNEQWHAFAEDYQRSSKKGLKTSNCETIHRSRSGLHFNLLLMEIRVWLSKNPSKPKRVVVDGISHLAATHTKQEFSQMLDALILLMKEYPNGSDDDVRGTLFMTYDSSPGGAIFDSEAFKLPADNIVTLSHKAIEFEWRTAVTVIKSSHTSYDSMVRELVLDHDNPYRTHIKSGFDAYSGLLTGNLQQATVVLQLFQENQAERNYNRCLLKHLKNLLPYEFALRDFSRFEIAATLSSSTEHIRIPSGGVQVTNIDEWWLAHKTALVENKFKENSDSEEAAAVALEHRLTNLSGFVNCSRGSVIKPGHFFSMEMEKGMCNSIASGIGPYGVPAFIDFGMFCVHREVAGIKASANLLKLLEWEEVDQVPWSRDAVENRDWYVELLKRYMIPWCKTENTNGKLWFKSPNASRPRTLVDHMRKAINGKRDGEGGVKFGFAFDSRTAETVACMFYELAWAFGAPEGIFTEGLPQNRKAVNRALSFVGFLVFERLMPGRPTLTDTAESAFSRHFFSTYIDVNLRSQTGSPKAPGVLPSAEMGAPIISLGFMPPGPEDSIVDREIDANVRFERLKERLKRMDANLNLTAWTSDNCEEKWRKVRSSYSCETAFWTTPNPTDIDELIRWNRFRKRIRLAKDWKTVFDESFEMGKNVVDRCRTGYGCCGAWMVGIKSPTASPGVAQVILEEITSLKFSKSRARLGAGLPARQDFYHHYGDRPVTGMAQLSWSEMLRNLGSRARRRDRIYRSASNGGATDPAVMHQLIQHSMNRIMDCAQTDGIRELQLLAEKQTQELFQAALQFIGSIKSSEMESLCPK